jgi:hypothetical protein
MLKDGDDAINGKFFPFQMYNRFKNWWRQSDPKSNISNPQPGMGVNDSDDERIFNYKASEYQEILTEASKNTFQNQLSNSGIGVWSLSDTNKGLGSMTYDAGSAGAGTVPDVGATATGGTSGAVGKVISYTITGGAFATNDAVGVITLGACIGRFQDNETVTFTGGETVVVNMPDASPGVDLVQNGDFTINTDPPPGWVASASATLTTEAGGQIGNCMRVTNTAAIDQYASQTMTVEVGKIYHVRVYGNDNTANIQIKVGTAVGNGAYYDSGSLAPGAWTAYDIWLEATTVNLVITLYAIGAIGTNAHFDEIFAYEATPCCTGANTYSFDKWYKTSALDIYRQHDDGGTLTKDGSFYSLQIVPTAAGQGVLFPEYSAPSNNAEWFRKFAGRPVTFGCWIKTSTASHARLRIYDGAANNSSYHTGGGAWEWIEVTRIVTSAVASLYFEFRAEAAIDAGGDTLIYISQPMLVIGNFLGEGNYQNQIGETVWLERKISSFNLNAKTALSDVAWADLNVEADSQAMLPKGCKAIKVYLGASDSGSAANDTYIALRRNALSGDFFYCNLSGQANSTFERVSGEQFCDNSGDIQYQIEASGAGTFNSAAFLYQGVQVS